MTRPWETLERVETDEGTLELRRRGDDEFHILVAGRVLMASAAHRSEELVAEAACSRLAGRSAARVLIGGLGMGYTLRAALDALPPDARVTVAELTPAVAAWCRGPLATLTSNAVADPRARIEIVDVADLIAAARSQSHPKQPKQPKQPNLKWDAIILDLYEGPREAHGGDDAPFWGRRALATTRDALAPGGVFAVWSEDPDRAFERRLAAAGFEVERHRPKSGGPRHVVYLATPK